MYISYYQTYLCNMYVTMLILQNVLKPFQNKKGQKKIPGAQFSASFSQLPAVKKDTENCAPGNFFGPSYFEAALVFQKEGHFQ